MNGKKNRNIGKDDICQGIYDIKKSYVGYNRIEQDRVKSSSGGVFSLIAKYVLSNKGVVYGAAFDDEFLVYHKKIENIEQLDEIIGSKYMQSRMGNCYNEIRSFLKQGRPVLFAGTTCQIAGLKNFLGGNYRELITVDFICLGVPSPKVWKDYIDTYFKDEKIEKINFKDKKRGWHTFSLDIKTGDREFNVDGKKTFFFSGYFKGLYSRPCCSECVIKRQRRRVSDITLSDSWGCEAFALELDDNKGLSNIIIHSEMGEKVFTDIAENLIYKEVAFEKLVEKNSGYYTSKPLGVNRSQFWADYDKIRKKKLFRKYCSSTYSIRSIYRKFRQEIVYLIIRYGK